MRAALVIVLGAAIAGLAIAQTGPAHPVLHEDLPAPAGGDRPAPTIGGGGSNNPTAITVGDKTLPKPSLEPAHDRSVGKGEPVLGKGGFAADRQTAMRADENTGADSTLHYVSVFNPDVLPFKRMSAFDQVGDDYTLRVNRTVLSPLAVGGSTDPRNRDRFWGDVLVELTPGVDVPLPSVAPDMRILSYEVKPAIRLAFSKDGADNFYVRTDEPHASGTYRLVFFADADAGYFAPSLPPHKYTVQDVAVRVPPELKPIVPDAVAREALTTTRKIGVDPTEDLGFVFNSLVGYFRGFQAGDVKHPSGNTYRDLCDEKVGVCRHRSFAFMITANALGIPTRLVENEAHAFVEVWFPDRNWQRIDLGGAALRMDVTGADNKTLHRPRAEDPFAKPPEYKQSYTQLEGEIHGLTSQQIADKHKSLDQSPSSGSVGNGPGNLGTAPDRITPDQSLQKLPPDPQKPTPQLVVTLADSSAYRGDLIHVEGTVRARGQGLADHVVRVFIAPAGEGGNHSVELGTATTAKDGTFREDLVIPGSVTLQNYEIFLSSSEDASYNAALSD